jgi:hypothetical protein
MAQRAIPRPINPFIPELMNPTPIGMQPGMMQPPVPPTLASAPRKVPTTVEPLQQGFGASAAPAMPPMPAPAPQGGGFMGNLKSGASDFLGSDASLAFAAGLLGGGPTNEAVGRAFGNAFQARQKEAPATTDDITEFAFAKRAGYEGDFPTWMREQKMAGAQKTYGTPPAGFRYVFDDYGNPVEAVPVAGSPAAAEADAAEAQKAEQKGQDDVATRIVTSAASKARDAANKRLTGAVGQPLAEWNPLTASAEVSRQVEVLKSHAKVENLTAMRQASPTGGALGAVSDRENEMLAAKSGALNPASPTFLRDLDDYELTLLQVIHGPEAGTMIFQQTRAADGAEPSIDDLVKRYGGGG